MAIAMGVLGVLAIVGGWIQIPGVDRRARRGSSSGTFEELGAVRDRALDRATPGSGCWSAALISIAGIALAYFCYVAGPGSPCGWPSGCRRTHGFLLNKWYFDELLDALVYRPAIAIGRFANSVFERFVVDGIVNGAVGVVRGAGADRPRRPVGLRPRLRAAADRRLRRARRLLPGGGELMLNVLLLDAARRRGLIAARAARSPRGGSRVLGALVDARPRDRAGRRLRLRRGRAPARRRRELDPRPRRPLLARRRRDQRLPRPDDGRALVRGDALVGAARLSRTTAARSSYYFLSGSPRPRRSAPSSPRTCSSSSSSST